MSDKVKLARARAIIADLFDALDDVAGDCEEHLVEVGVRSQRNVYFVPAERMDRLIKLRDDYKDDLCLKGG